MQAMAVCENLLLPQASLQKSKHVISRVAQ
jgi:hypothetical protein